MLRGFSVDNWKLQTSSSHRKMNYESIGFLQSTLRTCFRIETALRLRTAGVLNSNSTLFIRFGLMHVRGSTTILLKEFAQEPYDGTR